MTLVILRLFLSLTSATAQIPALAYSVPQLDCARFLETSESKILTQSGGRTRRQTSARRGRWQFRAAQSGPDLTLEAWIDSLAITRRSEETAISPDTDGLLGGRYRGALSQTGDYTAHIQPFVPDEVAEVAGMAHALDDFFPRLPGRALGEGEMWADSLGMTIRRLPDSAALGARLQRFDLKERETLRAAPAITDTLPLAVRQRSAETGRFVWHPRLGLLRRERAIVIETTVPPSRSVRQAVRSKVEQRITLVRDLSPPRCENSDAP